jgi:cytochrome c oxidase subunit IV
MSAQASSPEITFHPEHSGGTKRIWRTFWLLSLLTIIELVIGLVIYNMHKGEHPNASLVLAFKGLVCILTLAKAYYIVSIFMHLGDEVRFACSFGL